MKKVLITGATGDVGTHLSRELAQKYKLRLSDKRPIKAANFMKADITKMADCLRITKGMDAIVHLGGYSVEGPWESILQANIIGCYNVFEAARRNGVKRIVFPTSNHATGFYRRDQTIDHRVYPKPDSRYGVSKVFGEALGSLYADKYGMEMFMVRIGNVNPAPLDKRRLSIWISPRDIAQLSRSASTTPASSSRSSTACRATSAAGTTIRTPRASATGRRTIPSRTRRRSWRRKSRATTRSPRSHQGGIFCTAEEVPNPAAPKKKAKQEEMRLKAPAGTTDTHMHFYDGAASAAPGTPNPGHFTVPMYRSCSSASA